MLLQLNCFRYNFLKNIFGKFCFLKKKFFSVNFKDFQKFGKFCFFSKFIRVKPFYREMHYTPYEFQTFPRKGRKELEQTKSCKEHGAIASSLASTDNFL